MLAFLKCGLVPRATGDKIIFNHYAKKEILPMSYRSESPEYNIGTFHAQLHNHLPKEEPLACLIIMKMYSDDTSG